MTFYNFIFLCTVLIILINRWNTLSRLNLRRAFIHFPYIYFSFLSNKNISESYVFTLETYVCWFRNIILYMTAASLFYFVQTVTLEKLGKLLFHPSLNKKKNTQYFFEHSYNWLKMQNFFKFTNQLFFS